MILLVISLLAGVLTVLAPCVLPVLPIILGGAVGGRNSKRPYVICATLGLSVVVFTIALKVSTVLVGLPPSVLTDVSGIILIALGVVAMWPEAWEWLVARVNLAAASEGLLRRSAHVEGEYVSGVLVGASLGPVFASCSPTYAFILASVLPFSLAAGLAYLVAYAVGLVGALLVVSLLGRKYISRYGWAIDNRSWFRRSLGVLFVLIGLLVMSGYLVQAEVWVANRLPFDEAKLETTLLNGYQGRSAAKKPQAATDGVLNVSPYAAPEFAGLSDWINSQPLTMAGLRGKVVLVDFWTYSCINCIRTLPYIEKWNDTYADQGLVIVGVSAPEFAFEHNPANVSNAVRGFGIRYPVALDNQFTTWHAFQNDSWPADYLIDKNGYVRYTSFGEGDYDKTEKAIQTLLGLNRALTTPTSVVPITADQTEETYFGTRRAGNYQGKPGLSDGTASYTPQSGTLDPGIWTLGGSWTEAPESITSNGSNSTFVFQVSAKDVYMVASSADGATHAVSVGVRSDIPNTGATDIKGGNATVQSSRLYHIVSLSQFGNATITLTVPKGVSLYTFTFGS